MNPKSQSESENTMIFGMNVKVAQTQKRAKTFMSIGLLCMILALFFHITGERFQSELMFQSSGRPPAPEVLAWIRTCSTLSFVCMWIAVMVVFQVLFQHRKSLQSLG